MRSYKLIFFGLLTLIPLLVFGQTWSYLQFNRYVSEPQLLIINGRGYLKAITYDIGDEKNIKGIGFSISVVHEEPNNPNSKNWKNLYVYIPGQLVKEFLRMAQASLIKDVFELTNLPLSAQDMYTVKANDISTKQFRLILPSGQAITEGTIKDVYKEKSFFYLTEKGSSYPLPIHFTTSTVFEAATGERLSPDEVLQKNNEVLVRYDVRSRVALKVVLLEKAKPLPTARIISLPRTQEIRLVKAGEEIKETFAFALENFPESVKDFNLRFDFSHNLLKDVRVEVEGVTSPSVETRMRYFSDFKVTLPSANGTFTVNLIGKVRDYQDKDYPYQGGLFKIEFVKVTPLAEIRYESEGKDVSKTYAIHVPYYPNASSSATVGSEEYPALVLYQDPSTKEVGIYFTSFDGRFRSIHVGLEHPNGQRKEIVKDCKGSCSRSVDQLIKQFGHPAEWGFLILKLKPERTVINTGNLTMDRCGGTLYFDLSKIQNQMMVCSNRKAFGNNYGWGRKMVANIRWNYQPINYQYAEKLEYEFILPRDIDQHFPPGPRKKEVLKEQDIRQILQILSNILQQLQ